MALVQLKHIAKSSYLHRQLHITFTNMRVSRVLVLCMLLLQVQGKFHKRSVKLRTKGAKLTHSTLRTPLGESGELSLYPPFFDHCRQISDEPDFDTIIIKAVLDAIQQRLETVCNAAEKQSLIPAIVGGNLYCQGNLPTTADTLLDYILDKVDRDCEKLHGFHSVYVYTNELEIEQK